MKPYCIIPARGNSKGLRNKNVLFFDDRPLILHTVDQAIESGLFELEDIIVSTDSDAYIEICDTRGITTIKRPDHLATDTSSSYDVLEDLFKNLDNNRPFVLLQVTSPLRTAQNIQEAYNLFLKCNKKTVVSMKDVGVDLRITTRLSADNKVIDGKMLDKGIRRQDGEIYYRPNGAIYIAMINEYMKTGSFMTTDTTAYIMGKNNSLDIDEYDDFVLASLYKKTLNAKSRKVFNQNHFSEAILNCKGDKVIITDNRFKKLKFQQYDLIAEKNCKIKNVFTNMNILNKMKEIILFVNIDEVFNVAQFKSYFNKLVKYCNDNEQKLVIVAPVFTSYVIGYRIEEMVQFNTIVKQLCEKNQLKLIDFNDKIAKNGVLDFRYSLDGVMFNDSGYRKIQTILNKNI